MRSARAAAFSSSATRFHATTDYPSTTAFQMPAYTSHTARTSPTKTRSGKHPVQHPTPNTTSTPHDSSYQLGSESDQNLLAMLTSTVACLKEKHMDLEALGCMEQSLWLKRRMFGIDSPAVSKALHDVVLSYNSLAMQCLGAGQFDPCLLMLRKAEAITSPPGNFHHCQSLQILTYNNIGCCYRKLGKLKSALKYLKEAAQIGAACTHVKNLSITHLNLCAIQSQLGHHDVALEHAQAAIFHTQEELVILEEEKTHSEEGDGDVLEAKSREEKIVSLAVAYHNLAVELEFNGRGDASLQWYKKALQLVQRFRESNHALCDSFEKIFVEAKRKYHQPLGSSHLTRGARPQSAHHASSARGGGRQSAPGVHPASRDVSYSATVASHCYKPTKPSAAGLQYTRTSPTKPAARNPSAVPTQRPSSANSSRRRPLSASASTRQPKTTHLARPLDECFTFTDDTIEQRWKQIEQELFGTKEPTAASEQDPYAETPALAYRGRPHCARHVQRASHTRGPEPSHHRVPLDRGDVQLMEEEDDACGIVQDESDDDEEFNAQFLVTPAHTRDLQRNATGAQSRGGHANRTPPSSSRRTDLRQSQPQPTNGLRHRHVLQESRYAASSRSHDRAFEDDSDGLASSSGYAREEEEDDRASLSESSTSTATDLPQYRVGHVEYLRRMKRLSDSIHDDLAEMAPVSRQDPRQKAESVRATRGNARQNRTAPAAAAKPRQNGDGEEPVQLTPRSASSKVRERLELVRRNSIQSLDQNDMEAADDTENDLALVSGIVIPEAVHVFTTENDVVRAEQALLAHASARRIQLAARGGAACRRFEALRQQRETERAIQMNTKRAAIEAKEVELQARRAARLAERVLQAAIMIQKEQEEEMQQAQRDDRAARIIQRTYRQHLSGYDRDEDEALSPTQCEAVEDQEDQPIQVPAENGKAEKEKKEEEVEEEEEEPHYTPLPSARSTASPRVTETIANASLLNTPRSSVDDSDDSLLLTSRSPLTSSRLPSFQSTPLVSSRHSLNDHHDAAVCIQCAFRKHRASHHVATHHAQRLSRSYIERHHFRLVLTHADANEISFLEELSAIKVQAVVRGRQTRFLYGAMVIGRHAAASTIQRSVQRHHHRVRHAASRGVESLAARTIQNTYRAYAMRVTHQQQLELDGEAEHVHRIAAQTVQRRWRQWCQQRDHRVEEYEAATCIQALSRGHVVRKSNQSLKASESRASAFSMDHDTGVSTSCLDLREELDHTSVYEDAFDEEDEEGEQEKQLSPVVAPSHTTNLSFLPLGVRQLFMRYTTSPHLLPTRPATVSATIVNEMLDAGYGLEEMAHEFESCHDVGSAVTVLDTMIALVELHADRFETLPHLIRVAHALETRRQEADFWEAAVETRAAAFVLLYHDLIMD